MRPPAPIIVTAEIGPADFAWLDRLRRQHYPPERNQVPAHCTLFRHLPPSLLPELAGRLARAARAMRRPSASIGEPMLLEQGVALRVRCTEVEHLRAELAEAFEGVLTPQDRAGWIPHVTIQNKAKPAAARRLHSEMASSFAGTRPLAIIGLATHYYRGGPWEPIARYRFAG